MGGPIFFPATLISLATLGDAAYAADAMIWSFFSNRTPGEAHFAVRAFGGTIFRPLGTTIPT
jgi:hypothetical protein